MLAGTLEMELTEEGAKVLFGIQRWRPGLPDRNNILVYVAEKIGPGWTKRWGRDVA